ncbi:MAG: carboxypeptidase-like regulatory domain-containing protein, partial [Terriglobales bacterium]
MESSFRSIWTYTLLALVVLALSVGAFAQGGVGQLTGLVTDTTGAVAAGVEVRLTNSATGVVRTTVTTSAGTYNFPALPIVGAYTLEITAKGFKS